jgi:hypothetical protein
MRRALSAIALIACLIGWSSDGRVKAAATGAGRNSQIVQESKGPRVEETENKRAEVATGAEAGEVAQREPPIPKELRERMGEWAEYFLSKSPSYAAEETLFQTLYEKRGSSKRVITSDYLCVRMEGEARERWEFRDVLTVDGKEMQKPEKRAEKWPKIVAARLSKDIAALMEGPGKYLIAPEEFSGLALLVGRLATRHQEKMNYFFAQDTSDAGSRNVLVGYRQVTGEGLLVVDGKPVYPAGQAWVDPDTGHVVRIEEEFEHKQVRYWTAVEFAQAEALDAWLPREITVRVFEKGRLTQESVYSYDNFRGIGGDKKMETGMKQ